MLPIVLPWTLTWLRRRETAETQGMIPIGAIISQIHGQSTAGKMPRTAMGLVKESKNQLELVALRVRVRGCPVRRQLGLLDVF